jgi:hypothetical protein
VKRFFSTKRLMTALLVFGWLAASGWGMWRLAAYSLASGPAGSPPPQWPVASAIARNGPGFTAVLALHPECSCSEATLEELDHILARSDGRLRAKLLFVELPDLLPVAESALWRRAQKIAGVDLVKDTGGVEARRFGTRTSGETRLYAPDGTLWFHGGITAARGHAGDNPGQDAIIQLVHQQTAPAQPITTPVFGCALWNDAAIRKQ